MLKSDSIAMKLLEQWKIPMPDQNLCDLKVKQYIAYFKWADEHIQPKGKTRPQPTAPGTSLPPSETKSAPNPGARQ